MLNKYYTETRPELLKIYPKKIDKLLDVGCSSANFSCQLKKLIPQIEVWGIEIDQISAQEAKNKIDKVLVGDLNVLIEKVPDNYFDCIGFNDILEHIYSPADVLNKSKSKLVKDGVIVISIPNFLHIRNILNVFIRRNWEYTSEGTLDKTHIRFFTKKSLVNLFKENDFDIILMEGINPTNHFIWRFFNLLTFKYFDEFSYLQFACILKSNKF